MRIKSIGLEDARAAPGVIDIIGQELEDAGANCLPCATSIIIRDGTQRADPKQEELLLEATQNARRNQHPDDQRPKTTPNGWVKWVRVGT